MYFICYNIFLNGHTTLNIILLSLWDCTALLIGFYQLYHALRAKEKRVRWLLFVAFSLGCTVVDERVTEPVLLGIFSWLILFLMFLISDGYLERFRQACFLRYDRLKVRLTS